MELLDRILHMDIVKNKGSDWSFVGFRKETMKHIPQQQNGYDCGVFVFNFMDGRALDEMLPSKVYYWEFTIIFVLSHILVLSLTIALIVQWRSHDERAKVVMKLVYSKHNKVRETLFQNAAAHKFFSPEPAPAPTNRSTSFFGTKKSRLDP